MNAKLKLIIFLAALGCLLAGAARSQTAVAPLPLKASVLAKPNIIFSLDNSGSMDWEILLDTTQGIAWWKGGSAWDTASGRPVTFNFDWPMGYLFPLGTATGAALYAQDGWEGYWGQAIPPINQLAWTRSNRFNPIYYDSLTTYTPWSPAYVNGALRTYADASPTAASSHPAVPGAPTLNLVATWNSSNPNFGSSGFRFIVHSGMTLPAGTRHNCSGGEVTLFAPRTMTESNCRASIPYYPATFWHWQPSCTAGATCVAAPDGSGVLERYEIRSTTARYPSGRTYAQEIQNFANWFTYYRKRKLMLANSMGQVMEGISGVRLAVVPFTHFPEIAMRDADSANPAANRQAIAGEFYLNAMIPNATYTHNGMSYVGRQYQSNTSIVQQACQRNNMFIVTDGFSDQNGPAWPVPPYDASRWGSTRPYATTFTGTQADIALYSYTNRLRPDLPAGRVPFGSSTGPGADRNPDLHINTYALTLGARGLLWPATADPFVTFPTWTVPPAGTPAMIDDLWHATINGRGLMYQASSPRETAASIRAGVDAILDQQSTQGGLAVSSVNLARSDGRAYVANYNVRGWTGDLQAVTVNPATGELGNTPLWSAATLLGSRDWTTRSIATWNGTAGAAFTAANVGAALNPAGVWGVTGEVVDYLRGDRRLEGSKFRRRSSLMGAVINAEPVVDRETGIAYIASGEGMLHAVDIQEGTAGRELWAYVPGSKLPDLGQTTSRSYTFTTQLDGTPVLRKLADGSKLLVAGQGVAGRAYYALDVTSPRGRTEASLAASVKWEFPRASDTAETRAKVGQTLGKPAIVRLANGMSAVLVTSGYNSSFDGRGRLWVLNANTGALIDGKEYVTTEGTLGDESGLAHISAMAEVAGTVRYVYGGDLRGRVWRFDLSLAPGDPGAVTKLAELRGPSGAVQPVTTAPELLVHQGRRIVYVGTGRLLDFTDFGSNAVQSMYAIKDDSTLANGRDSLVRRELDVAANSGNGSLAGNAIDWGTQPGWYVDLPAGEQINTLPTIAFGALVFMANRTGASDCAASSRLYAIDTVQATQSPLFPFVSQIFSSTSNASAVTVVLSKDGKTLRANARQFDTGAGKGPPGSTSVPIRPAKNAWREIRR